jgi:hypothetical protein
VPVYSHEDFFGSTPGDFGDGILWRLPASDLPSLSAFRPPTPPGGVIKVIIHFQARQVKRRFAHPSFFPAPFSLIPQGDRIYIEIKMVPWGTVPGCAVLWIIFMGRTGKSWKQRGTMLYWWGEGAGVITFFNRPQTLEV